MNLRRTTVALLVTGLVGASAGTAAATPHGAAHGHGIEAGDHAFVDVTTATLWVEPGLDRPVDAPSLTNPVDLDQWNRNMADTETRRWLTGKLETQAVLGSGVEVTEVDGDWAHVVVEGQDTPRDDRGYPGWMPVDQLVENDKFDALVDTRPWAQVTGDKTWLTGTPAGAQPLSEISFNTRLPVLAETPQAVRVALPDGSRAWLEQDAVDVHDQGEQPAAPTGEDLVATGKQFLGLRYLWAGVSAYGFDCSGFTYSVHRAHGVSIPRDSSAQAEYGQDVAVEDLQPGDLLFFAQPGGVGRVHHVGMYIGEGKMIHAPNASESVSIVDWQEWDTDDEFSGAKRMI
ncbi:MULTISPECIES: C40 family peptidase [Prauserella salsuginis group]|uniref:NlpC/P60 family protein n=1 Tax=Prauserella salsuginis TaxID=387889 RepID=A0ABW6GC55_9PSEU|nr:MULTISPECIES: C40 family peptidase [Prauserella salsuginis group]MCR3722481.1 NlpC/P60 family protein [Prauserella flava]MCR3736923.1 NlpC/P60 family protein [Prauserella salsuginis]